MDDVDIRRVEAFVRQSKTGTRDEREKARKEIDRYRNSHPGMFQNGYFKPPKYGDFLFPPIEEDDSVLIECLTCFRIQDIDSIVDRAIAQIKAADESVIDWVAIAASLNIRFKLSPSSAVNVCREVLLHMVTLFTYRRDETKARIAEAKRDHDLEALKEAAPYLDQNWNGKGWKPSEIIEVGYYISMTRDAVRPNRGSANGAKKLLRDRLDEARRRYAKGFYANPFGEPVPRPR